ncbi:hypothetical protein L1077_26985 [Pseudoalteromonas luteoviolacea]|uniref:hypothetical protein n=1 Tax=Pseudoalteromonas luteoviolacea TaxID=43657 RepID=UPI001F1B9D5C|nr:hypothetical protein [Pseudoalteromonas luteoviolacea]MCF6443076.1 hypothetical protein [Pseudoalteromonas luteoviolacea]
MTKGIVNMRRIIPIFLALVLLQGCDAADDMIGMFEKQELAQELIKSKYGWESQLGFSIDNGTLTQVTIILEADEVRGETVENLEKVTNEVVSSVFKSTPKAIYIQIASQPESQL